MRVFKIVCRRERVENYDVQWETYDLLLGAYRKAGHILGRELVSVSLPERIESYVFGPAEDAFDAPVRSSWISQRVAEARAMGLSEPEFTEIGEDPSDADGCTCSTPASYILFTTYLQVQSPVRCGDCFLPFPLYRIPLDIEDCGFLAWESNWKSCDSMFMLSSTGEKFGYREMSRADSSLTKAGRAICDRIEASTEKPA